MEGEPSILCPAVTMFRDTFRTPFTLKHLLPEKLLLLATPSGSRNSGAEVGDGCKPGAHHKGMPLLHCALSQKICPLLVPEDLPTACARRFAYCWCRCSYSSRFFRSRLQEPVRKERLG